MDGFDDFFSYENEFEDHLMKDNAKDCDFDFWDFEDLENQFSFNGTECNQYNNKEYKYQIENVDNDFKGIENYMSKKMKYGKHPENNTLKYTYIDNSKTNSKIPDIIDSFVNQYYQNIMIPKKENNRELLK